MGACEISDAESIDALRAPTTNEAIEPPCKAIFDQHIAKVGSNRRSDKSHDAEQHNAKDWAQSTLGTPEQGFEWVSDYGVP